MTSEADGAQQSQPQRPLRSSELLLMELLHVAQRRLWVDYAVVLLKQRATQHVAALEWAHAAAIRESGGDSDPPVGLLGTALEASCRERDRLRDYEPTSQDPKQAITQIMDRAKDLLEAFDDSLRGLPDFDLGRMDHSIEVRHRRFVVLGREEPPDANREFEAMRADVKPPQLHAHALSGLSLSGGGIRSASFSIGAMQAMTKSKLLPAFEYISSGSGGGYAASWLAAWSYRHKEGIHGVDAELHRSLHSECGPLHWVRRHSSYLATHPKLTSGDVWALAVAYISNWLPVLMLVLLAMTAVLTIPYAARAVAEAITDSGRILLRTFIILAAAIGLVLYMGLIRRLTLYHREPIRIPRFPHGLAALVFLGAWTLNLALALATPIVFDLMQSSGGRSVVVQLEQRTWSAAWIWMGSLWMLAHLASVPVAKFLADEQVQVWIDRWRPRDRTRVLARGPLLRNEIPRQRVLLSMLINSVVASLLFTLLLPLFRLASHQLWLQVALGPVVLMSIMAVSELIAVLVVARFQRDVDRAWAARVGAWILAGVLAWTGLAVLSLSGQPIWFDERSAAQRWLFLAVIGLPCALITWFWTARLKNKWMSGCLAAGTAAAILIAQFVATWCARSVERNFAAGVDAGFVLSASLVTLGLISKLVDVNRFSLHALYRDGLVRTFLGASRLEARNPNVAPPTNVTPPKEGCRSKEVEQFRIRRPDPVTNIDDHDNPLLSWLQSKSQRELPVFLLNAAVNGASVTDQEGRFPRQWPFTFSQHFCGSPAGGIGYARTDEFFKDSERGGLTLGEAMAVSGAAMSPTSGYRTHPIKAALYGLLNARLGLWIGNPCAKKASIGRSSPSLGGMTVLQEMLGHRGTFGRWIHLSDGGHFESLGIYELLRRGCMRIVAIDASCDQGSRFDEFANAILRARVDLAINVYPTETQHQPDQEEVDHGEGQQRADDTPALSVSNAAWKWFEIDYGSPLPRGKLLYIKPTVDGIPELPIVVTNYKCGEPAFPHESTADQFFTERQVEAYRALGERCTDAAMGNNGAANDGELRRMIRRAIGGSRKPV